ncbi:MAG: DUF4338 domain-containing protein, partial [Deltaproteobacteria bacterium]|nr:DUF4338 domain-containing protein [Deltaproteobacteria bacterium]
SCVLRRLRTDWQDRYGLEPWLVETLVDRGRYYGGCYRAANFILCVITHKIHYVT